MTKDDEMKKKGLTIKEAKKRLEKYGRNEIKLIHKINPLKIFISQFTSPLILILIAAALISWGIEFFPGQESNIADTILILLIVMASGISGFFQDYKAEKTIEALKKMATPKSMVIRNGKEMEINATDIVPGDIILLKSGDIIPADAEIIESFNLMVNESMLTGESQPAEKKIHEKIFMNTFVNSGNARAVVVQTGMRASVGKIAEKLQGMKEEKTPFQKEFSRFSKNIIWAIIFITITIAIISFFKYSLYESLLVSISLAVAAIPEGLPAVIILTLAVGAKVMSGKNALIRKLPVTESIGSIDIICSDKTGTLTENEMIVSKLFFNNKEFYAEKLKKNYAKKILFCGSLCNNSGIIYKNRKKTYIGDPTEIALRKISDRYGFEKEKLEKKFYRINEIPFTSKRKMMSVVYRIGSKKIVYSKGAPEILIKKCNKIYQNGRTTKLTENTKKLILKKNREFASQALRVLGFAFEETKNSKVKEKNMVWIGLQAMSDPPRKGVAQAIKTCITAGIRVIMLTGDNPLTAKSVANKIGLKSGGVIEGDMLDKINDKKLESKLNEEINIFARISPFHKLRILKILKKKNRVAMTGDGVNDALALKKADVGIAVRSGTEVAKEASDMILLDDNFASITAAIKEGRRIFDNIRKFVNYLFVCNFAEVAVLFMASLFLILKDPILLPIQILWINLLTDGLPALALGIDPARPDVMKKKPRKKGEPIINNKLWWLIITIGSKKTVILFTTFFLILPMGLDSARTALFTGFILYEFVRIGSIRYQEKLSWLANKWLLLALAGSVLLQLLIIYSPLNKLFHIVPLGLYEWMILITGVLVGYITAIMITKIIEKYVKE